MDRHSNSPDSEKLNSQLSGILQRIALSRSESAIEELYDLYAGQMFGLIISFVKDRAAAEDILQECFVNIWEKARLFDPKLGNAKSWVLTMARNKSYDYLDRISRKASLHSSQVDVEERMSDQSCDLSTVIAIGEESRRALTALKKLNQDQQQAIRMVYLKGLTQSEVADKLGEPLGTIKARIRRGLMALRRFLSVEESGGTT
jgi:RNA polymerase sigma-70 factor (ECF subfamily)